MIEFRPTQLRGFNEYPVWTVYVDNTEDKQSLCQIKREVNNPPVKGIVFIENKSRAIERMGWEKFDNGIYYKIFE